MIGDELSHQWWSQYVDAPVDYSPTFDDRVAVLADRLQDALGADIHVDSDMNYNAGQRIMVYLADDGTPMTDMAAARYRVVVMISSKGPLWARSTCRTHPDAPGWFRTPASSISDLMAGNDTLLAISGTLAAAKLRFVPDEVLDVEIDCKVTMMDELPATVRDVLFCEIC
jgi:hypothetical protein